MVRKSKEIWWFICYKIYNWRCNTLYTCIHLSYWYFLERYGNLEYYANYAIKGCHKYNKRIIRSSTSGFRTQNKNKTLPFQELERIFRDMRQQIEKNLDSSPIHKGIYTD